MGKQNSAVLLAGVISLFVALTASTPGRAQYPMQHGWGTVQALAPGAKVTVKAYNQDRLRGSVAKVDQDSVVVITKHGSH